MVSNIASISTLILFVLYFVGRIWRLKATSFVAVEKIVFTDEVDVDDENVVITDTDFLGQCVSISSPAGMRRINIYRYEEDDKGSKSKGELIRSFSNINANDEIYVFCNIPDSGAIIFVEIENTDYVKKSFGIADSGRNGKLIKENYTQKIGFRSWLYHLSM